MVICGTNPVSLYSWLFYDFNIKKLEKWKKIRGITSASDNVQIYRGSFLASKTLLKLVPPKNMPGYNKTFLAFFGNRIGEKERIKINITGHSLGGVMASSVGLF